MTPTRRPCRMQGSSPQEAKLSHPGGLDPGFFYVKVNRLDEPAFAPSEKKWVLCGIEWVNMKLALGG
jgi:hypothetical protein